MREKMRGIFISGTVFIFAIFAVFLAACSDTATTQTVEQSNKSVAANSAINNPDASTTNTAKAFTIDFKAEPTEIKSGVPATLSFTVKNNQGAIVKDLPIVHEKPMHLLVVSNDLAEFYHIHPEPQTDGSYAVKHIFPNGGAFRLYADFTPQDSKQVVERADIKVTGTERAKVSLTPDAKFEKAVSGLKIVMKPQGEIKAGSELLLEFAAFDEKTNNPATDLQNYLGELAHFVIISEDMQDFVHAHPMSKSEHEAMKMPQMKTGDHNADGHKHDDKKNATKTGSVSEVAAHTAFPRAGLYKIWAQFQRNNQIITVPFAVNVKANNQQMETKAANIPAGAVKVTLSGDGYSPASINVKKGQPVKLAFYRSDADNCGGEVVFAKQNITRKLPVGETVLIEFTPTEAGEINFTCGMGMYKGKVLVQ